MPSLFGFRNKFQIVVRLVVGSCQSAYMSETPRKPYAPQGVL
jgi:hypothetical protein